MLPASIHPDIPIPLRQTNLHRRLRHAAKVEVGIIRNGAASVLRMLHVRDMALFQQALPLASQRMEDQSGLETILTVPISHRIASVRQVNEVLAAS